MLMGSGSDLSDEVTRARLANRDLFAHAMLPVQFTYNCTFLFFFLVRKARFSDSEHFFGSLQISIKWKFVFGAGAFSRGKSGQSGAECK